MKNLTLEQQQTIEAFRYNLFKETQHFENALRQSPQVNFQCSLVNNFTGLNTVVDDIINKEFLPTISHLIFKNELGEFDDVLIEIYEDPADCLRVKIRIINPQNFKPL